MTRSSKRLKPKPSTPEGLFNEQVRRRLLPDLPLSQYLRCAWKYNEEAELVEGWRSEMWNFVLLAKSHPDLANCDADRAADVVEAQMRSWLPEPCDIWQQSFPDVEDPLMEFVATWPKIRVPLGTAGSLEEAAAAATRRPLLPVPVRTPNYGFFISILGHLQRLEGDRSIFVPCHKFSDLLDVTPMTISNYRAVAVKDGLLLAKKKGSFAARKADEFRFRLDAFDFATGHQIQNCKHQLFTQETQDTKDKQEIKTTQEAQENQRVAGYQENKDAQDNHGQISNSIDAQDSKREPQESQGSILNSTEGGCQIRTSVNIQTEMAERKHNERVQLLQVQKAQLLAKGV